MHAYVALLCACRAVPPPKRRRLQQRVSEEEEEEEEGQGNEKGERLLE